MMSNFQILHDIFDEKFIDKTGKLIESKGKKLAPQELIIKPIKDIELVVFRFDPDEIDLFPFFSRIKGLKRICDYIILAQKNKDLYILCVELKRGNTSAHKQLKASKSFVNFCIDTALRIGLELDSSKIKLRTITVKAKTPTRKENPEYNNDHMDYYWSNFELRCLLK